MRSSELILRLTGLVVVVFAATSAMGVAQTAEDRSAVTRVALRQFDTFEHRQAKEYGELFTEDSTFITVGGMRVDGKTKIVEANAWFFTIMDMAKTKMTVKKPSVKFMNPMTAVVYVPWSGLWTKMDKRAESGYLTMVMTKREGKWLIFSATNAYNFDDRPDYDLFAYPPKN